MNPAPIFQVCAADSSVTALFGVSPTRVYPFGEAQERPQLVTPYATWQVVGGSPGNYLRCPPDADSYTLQVDVFAPTISLVRQSAKALVGVIQTHAYVVNWRGELRDVETRNYRLSFDVDWIVYR